MYTPSVDYLSTGEGSTLPPWIIYPLERGVHFLRGLFIHWGGAYTPSVDCLSSGEGCTLPPWIIYPLERGLILFPPWIIYPLGRGVHLFRGLFIHWKGVYTSSVDYLST